MYRAVRNKINKMFKSPGIHEAARKGDLERVKHLLERGVSVDSRDGRSDRTPLHVAAGRGRYEVAKLLISRGCDLDPRDQRGRTPVMCAASQEVADLLLQSGAQVADDLKHTLLHSVSEYGWLDVVQRIVESGELDVDAADEYGVTPLMCAAMYGHEDVAAFLIRSGADVNGSDEQQRTALHCFALSGHIGQVGCIRVERSPCSDERVVKHFLAAGADTNLKDVYGQTALCVGIRSKQLTIVEIRLLVQHGAFFEACDYVRISQNPRLKECLLKDVDLCTQSIVNQFQRQSLPALYSNPHFAERLPQVEKLKLSPAQIDNVKNFVEWDIQSNTFCDVVKARPMGLSMMCVQALMSSAGLVTPPQFYYNEQWDNSFGGIVY